MIPRSVTGSHSCRYADVWRKDSLKTRPVSSSSPPVEAPEILPSRMEETSEAAAMGMGMVSDQHEQMGG